MSMRERIAEINPDAMLFDDLDSALIGIDIDGKGAYSLKRIIKKYMNEDGMTYDEAFDFFSYNTERTLPYMGEFRPIILDDFSISLETEKKEKVDGFMAWMESGVIIDG